MATPEDDSFASFAARREAALAALVERQSATRPIFRSYQYGFEPAILRPGETRGLEVEPKAGFRPQRLCLAAVLPDYFPNERGAFQIRHTRLPLLNRDYVIAYSNVTRNKAKRRTTVEYRESAQGCFVRTYRPENVVYVPDDPLASLVLLQLNYGADTMPKNSPGALASFFGPSALGNGMVLPTPPIDAKRKLRLTFKNIGTANVNVHATVFGPAPEQPPEEPAAPSVEGETP